MNVLRLCSVYEPDPSAIAGRGARFDPIGGMQNHTASLTRALDALGVEQTVVTSRLGDRTGTTTTGKATTVVRVGAPIRRARQLWAVDAARRLSTEKGPFDVVHAHQGEDLALLPLAVAAARRFDARLVVTVHCSIRHTLATTTPRLRRLHALGAPIERWGLRAADHVVTLTRRAADAVVADGVAAERVTVIPSGFEPALFDTVPTRTGPTPWPHVGYVGRLAPQKDVVGIVEAFGRLRTPGARLTIIGDGPDGDRVDAAIARSPARDRISRTGFVAHDRVPEALSSFDVFVMASVYEELGSVLVEAMRAGLPIVATAVGGIPEVIRHERTGLLVAPGDPAAMAAAVDRILDDPLLASDLRTGARAAAAAYAWDVLAPRVLGIYEAAATAPVAALVP